MKMKRKNKKERAPFWARKDQWIIDFKIRSRYGGVKYEEKEIGLRRAIKKILDFDRFQGFSGMDMVKLSLAVIWMFLIAISIIEGKQVENYNALFHNEYCKNGPGGISKVDGKIVNDICPVGSYTPDTLAGSKYSYLPVIQEMKRNNDAMIYHFAISWLFIIPLFVITGEEKLKNRKTKKAASILKEVSDPKDDQHSGDNQKHDGDHDPS